MTDPEADWTVLVPVEILEGETVPEALIDLLSTCSVVVLGYHVLPEQTAPGQARMQFEDQAQAKLDDLAIAFREAGGDAETRLVFTRDEEQTLNRVADEAGCEAILIPNPTTHVERILVPIRGEANVARIAGFVAALIGEQGIEVTVYHVAATDEEAAVGQSMVEEAAKFLHEGGLPIDAISQELTNSETPVQAIATAAGDHDVVVMGESEPSLRTFLFGEVTEQIAAHSLGPVIVVRREHESEV